MFPVMLREQRKKKTILTTIVWILLNGASKCSRHYCNLHKTIPQTADPILLVPATADQSSVYTEHVSIIKTRIKQKLPQRITENGMAKNVYEN